MSLHEPLLHPGPPVIALPQLEGGDHTLALLADPYRFIGRHCDALGSEVFETRLMLQPTLCLSGLRAARLFYDPEHFQREGAAPEPLRSTLFGHGGVQTLDGEAHRLRKALFLQTAAPDRVGRLAQRVRHEWEQALRGWSQQRRFSLYRAVQPVLTRAVCHWAGVPLQDHDVALRCRQLVALFDGAGSGVLGHLQARLARGRAEAWLGRMIEAARAGAIKLPADSPAAAVTQYREADGRWLPVRVAAVELLNLLRPVVAVSVYIAFVAHALHTHPEWRRRLADAGHGGSTAHPGAAHLASERDAASPPERPSGSASALSFVQEVRRHYPFFPVIAARVRHDFEWNGLRFPAGRRALLDLYGTNHDARAWGDPGQFRPERWQQRAPGRFDFVPQGGGDAAMGHRCPGEDATVQLMLVALQMLVRRMRYELPPQRLQVAMDRLPALPRDGVLIERVRPMA
ncbi:cytochrome P450 [Aquabacterium sp. J223]|uniref:cytochrome P450 n=1 Tax=Aquabacterium sp. J223 TaxID=2898431 RepID=UPI0021AD9024|nr:cytochrome P450 [Aquabacterium sp. J223]UUX95059.1 cytochrome P450 [Aquabacterium sp. J223]